jgi:NAD(P)-dependent dehydrogenase (short-subunit alcohol dehydrogenase family)
METNEQLLASLASDTALAGRTALVTGSSGGIGEAVARVLAASGAEVVVSGRDAGRARSVVDRIVKDGGRAHAITADLRAESAGIRAFARRSHVLVAELAPGMAERGAGVIVNIGSWMARVGVPYKALYPATKAAVEQLTRAWAAEYGPRGVRVNTVAPGATATRGTSADADRMAELTKGTPAGAAVRPVDIAYAVRFLASDQAALVHGATLDVDGGIAATRLR